MVCYVLCVYVGLVQERASGLRQGDLGGGELEGRRGTIRRRLQVNTTIHGRGRVEAEWWEREVGRDRVSRRVTAAQTHHT